jgi:hypothetical protein
MYRKYLFTYALIVFLGIGLFGQGERSWNSDLNKIESLFRSGKIELAEEFAEQVFSSYRKEDNIDVFYKVLSMTYKVKRVSEELSGIPSAYNYLNEQTKGLRKEKRLLMYYFQIRALREYYLDCLNTEDPWMKNQSPGFKNNVLILINRIGNYLSKKRDYGRYPINTYEDVFSQKTETFELNKYLSDKLLSALIEFYETALVLECKSNNKIEFVLNQNYQFSFSDLPSDDFESGIRQAYNARINALKVTDRDSLISLFLFNRIKSIHFCANVSKSSTGIDELIDHSDGIVGDQIRMEYANLIYENGLLGPEFPMQDLIAVCHRIDSLYRKSHFLNKNSQVLRNNLERIVFDVKGLAVVYPYNLQKIRISTLNSDTAYYVVCKNPFEKERSFEKLYLTKKIDGLRMLSKEYGILKGRMPLETQGYTGMALGDLEILGMPEGAYTVFIGSEADIFGGTFTLFNYKVSRHHKLELINNRIDSFSYNFQLDDFSPVDSEFPTTKLVKNYLVDYLFFDRGEVPISKRDELNKVRGTYLQLKSNGTILFNSNTELNLTKLKRSSEELTFSVGLTDALGRFEVPIDVQSDERPDFEILRSGKTSVLDSILLDDWFNKSPYYSGKLNLDLLESNGLLLDKLAYALIDTLQLAFADGKVPNGYFLVAVDGEDLFLLNKETYQEWAYSLGDHLKPGYHKLEVFFTENSRPKVYYSDFFLKNIELAEGIEQIAVAEENDSLVISGSFLNMNGGVALLVLGEANLNKAEIKNMGPQEFKSAFSEQFLDKFYSYSLGSVSAKRDMSKFLRRSFPVENRFKEYDCLAYDYKVSDTGAINRSIVNNNTGISSVGDEKNFWGFPSIKVVPYNVGSTVSERKTAQVVEVDESGFFQFTIPKSSSEAWDFKFLLIDSKGRISPFSYSLKF